MERRCRCFYGFIRVIDANSSSVCRRENLQPFHRFCKYSRDPILYNSLRSNLTRLTTCNSIRLWNGGRGFCIPFCSSSLEQIGGHNMDGLQDGCTWSEDCDKLFKAVTENSKVDQCMESALESSGATLTAETVGNILHRLHFDEKSALRFFTWAAQQDGYSHQPPMYNAIIDILSCTKYKARQYGIVCDILDFMKRKKKSFVPIETLLDILRKYAEKNLTSLAKSAKKKRIRVKTKPEINAFNLLLDSLCKCGLNGEAESMFNKLKNKISPDARTYNILFFGWCRVRRPKKAMDVLEEMIQMGHTPENFTYNAAIDTFCKVGMVSEASKLFEFMKTKGSIMSSPTARTYCIMIVALAKAERMDECFRVISDMRNSGCLPDVSTYMALIEGMCSAGKLEEAYKFLNEMGNKGYPPDIVTYNCFLKVLCNLKQVDHACDLFKQTKESGCLPSVQTYNMLINMFFQVGQIEKAIELWDEMDKNRCPRSVDSYCLMVEGLFNSGKTDTALLLLDDIMKKGIKLPYQKFDSFLMRLSQLGNLQTIHRLSDYMRRFYNHAMTRHFVRSQQRRSMSLRRK